MWAQRVKRGRKEREKKEKTERKTKEMKGTMFDWLLAETKGVMCELRKNYGNIILLYRGVWNLVNKFRFEQN